MYVLKVNCFHFEKVSMNYLTLFWTVWHVYRSKSVGMQQNVYCLLFYVDDHWFNKVNCSQLLYIAVSYYQPGHQANCLLYWGIYSIFHVNPSKFSLYLIFSTFFGSPFFLNLICFSLLSKLAFFSLSTIYPEHCQDPLSISANSFRFCQQSRIPSQVSIHTKSILLSIWSSCIQ